MQIKAQKRSCLWVSGNNGGKVSGKMFKRNERRRALIMDISHSRLPGKNEERVWQGPRRRGPLPGLQRQHRKSGWVSAERGGAEYPALDQWVSPFQTSTLLGLCSGILHIFWLQSAKSALTRTLASPGSSSSTQEEGMKDKQTSLVARKLRVRIMAPLGCFILKHLRRGIIKEKEEEGRSCFKPPYLLLTPSSTTIPNDPTFLKFS